MLLACNREPGTHRSPPDRSIPLGSRSFIVKELRGAVCRLEGLRGPDNVFGKQFPFWQTKLYRPPPGVDDPYHHPSKETGISGIIPLLDDSREKDRLAHRMSPLSKRFISPG